MKLKVAENSLFSILLRSRWWISVAIAAVITVAGLALLPREYGLFAIFTALPFAVIGVMAARKQFAAPSPARIEQLEQWSRGASWPAFSDALAAGLRADGYAVEPLPQGGEADFQLTRAGRVTALAAKRWKVARTGHEPLRKLREAMDAMDANEGIYIALGEVTETAAKFARENRIRIFRAAELAAFMRQS